MTNHSNGATGTAPRTWLITGASSGIGRALALAALARGERVAATARDEDSNHELTTQFPDQAITLALNVRDEQASRDAVARAVDAFGRLDVVANNAGIGLFGGVEEASDAQAREVFDTNVFGVLNVLRAALPVLRAQRSGHVLQGSSFYGQLAHAGVGMLAATKYALEGLSEALAIELAPLGIKLTLIEPSPTATSFLANLTFAETKSDYDPTVRAVQRALEGQDSSAFDDPARVAQAILEVVDAEHPPLRLALGRQAETDIRAALNARLSELAAWSGTTRAVTETPIHA